MLLTREVISRARRVLGWPTALGTVAYFVLPAFGIALPLVSTVILFAVALSYMFFAIAGSSYTLNYDGKYSRPDRPGLVLIAPIVIGLQGAQYSEYGNLDNHALVFALLTIGFAGLGFLVSVYVGRSYKATYEEVREMRARRALTEALDAANLSAASRASIEARAQAATYLEVEKITASLKRAGEDLPELLQ